MKRTESPFDDFKDEDWDVYKNQLPPIYPNWIYMYNRLDLKSCFKTFENAQQTVFRMRISNPRQHRRPIEIIADIDFIKARVLDELLAGVKYQPMTVFDMKHYGYITQHPERIAEVSETLMQIELLLCRTKHILEDHFPQQKTPNKNVRE